MLYCNLQVLFCTEIAVEKHFDPQNVTSEGASKNFLRLLSFAILYGPLINYAVIRPLSVILHEEVYWLLCKTDWDKAFCVSQSQTRRSRTWVQDIRPWLKYCRNINYLGASAHIVFVPIRRRCWHSGKVGVIFRLRQTEISGPKTLFSVWLRRCHLPNVI